MRIYPLIRAISMMVKLLQLHVRSLICEDPSLPRNIPCTRAGPLPKLTLEHVGYLTSPATLQMWASKSMAEHVFLFHRGFGEIKISSSSLLKSTGPEISRERPIYTWRHSVTKIPRSDRHTFKT